MTATPRDANRTPTLLGVSNSDGITAVPVYANPTTHGLVIDLPTGTVPSKTVASLDENRVESIMGVSSTDGVTPVVIGTKMSTHGLFVENT